VVYNIRRGCETFFSRRVNQYNSARTLTLFVYLFSNCLLDNINIQYNISRTNRTGFCLISYSICLRMFTMGTDFCYVISSTCASNFINCVNFVQLRFVRYWWFLLLHPSPVCTENCIEIVSKGDKTRILSLQMFFHVSKIVKAIRESQTSSCRVKCNEIYFNKTIKYDINIYSHLDDYFSYT